LRLCVKLLSKAQNQNTKSEIRNSQFIYTVTVVPSNFVKLNPPKFSL
jgi:hypothetical protein